MGCIRRVFWDRMELMGYLEEVRKLIKWEREGQSGLGEPNMRKPKEKGINQSAVCKQDWLVLLCLGQCVQGGCTTLEGGCSLRSS